MPSVQTTFLYNLLKHMSHKDRKAGVRDLMNVWPDEWLNDAIEIALEIRQKRQPLGAQAAQLTDNFGKSITPNPQTGRYFPRQPRTGL